MRQNIILGGYELGKETEKGIGKKEFRATIVLMVTIVSIIVGMFIFSVDSRFQGIQDSVDSFRTGLTDQITAAKSDLERIEKIFAVLEQRMDITTKEASDINQLLDSIENRLMDIEQILNQSTPPPSPSPQPVSLVISYPLTGDEVSWITLVSGNSTGIGTNKTLNLYLLVYPLESDGPWFVQNRPTINPDGSWSGIVYFGRNPDIHPEDTGDQFLLSVMVTTINLQPGETFTTIPESIYESSIPDLQRK